MQPLYFQAGVAGDKLLFSVVISSMVLMTSALTANLRLNDFILEQDLIQLNGIKDDTIDMFDKVMDYFSPHKNGSPGSRSRPFPRTRSELLRNIEYFTVHKVTGDGRCMFRALVKGMAANNGVALGSKEETRQADGLKAEIKRFICDTNSEHEEFQDAIMAITVEESLERYCGRIMHSGFWGGEAELLILSKLLSLPVIVYVPVKESIWRINESAGFASIARYRPEFRNGTTRLEPKNDVRIVFWGKLGTKHYDLLL